MKKIIYVALAMLIVSSCEKPNKIGYIDNSKVINDYLEKKDIEAKFQLKDNGFRRRADSIGKAFQTEVQNTQQVAQKSSPQKQQELMGGLQQKQQQLQQQMQIEQQQLTQEFQAEIDSVIVKVKDFVREYGKSNGYTYILGTSDGTSNVLYGSAENDLTKIILDSLNAAYDKK